MNSFPFGLRFAFCRQILAYFDELYQQIHGGLSLTRYFDGKRKNKAFVLCQHLTTRGLTYPLSWIIVCTNSPEIRANFVLSGTWLVVRSRTFVCRFTKLWLCIHMSSVGIPVNNVCDILPLHYRGINGYFADESDFCSLFIFMCNSGAAQVASRKLHR